MKALFNPTLRTLAATAAYAVMGICENAEEGDGVEYTYDGVSVTIPVNDDEGNVFMVEAHTDGDYTVTDSDGNELSFDEETGVTTFTDADGNVVKMLDADGNEVNDDDSAAGDDAVEAEATAEADAAEGDTAAA